MNLSNKHLRIGGIDLSLAVGSRHACASDFSEASGPDADSISWEVKFCDASDGGDFVMEATLPVGAGTNLWLSWADPRPGHEVKPDPTVRLADGVVRGDLVDWADPLVPQSWQVGEFFYGAPPYDFERPRLGYCPFVGAVTALPMVTWLDGEHAITMAFHPDDVRLDLVIEVTASGTIRFRHRHYRVGGGVEPRFRLEIFSHLPDVRAALGGFVKRWSEYFEAPLPAASAVCGTGAYSTHMGDMDPQSLRGMAFGVNWKASFDFPYMGMFLPPVDDEWTSFGGRPMSVARMRAYAETMRGHGFHVLSYFNLHEFGANVREPFERRAEFSEWLDQNHWLRERFPQALLHPPSEEVPDWPDILPQPEVQGNPPLYWSWEGCVAMDPGDPAYAEFLADQAAAHVRRIPDADGICIDRLDWVRLFNFHADDGIACVGGKTARSLHSSQRAIMERLAAILHPAGKVIFVNNHVKRIDQMRHVDGIFDEFTYGGCSLNTSGLLCLYKPALGWTADVEQLRADPDGFYQRHLHLGVYPMAPFPGNDHSLGPSEFANALASDYGPIFRLLKGKRWILVPGLVETGDAASRWNAFHCESGVLLVFTGVSGGDLDIHIRGADRLCLRPDAQGRVFHPGQPEPQTVVLHKAGGDLSARLPIRRGCAALVLTTQPL